MQVEGGKPVILNAGDTFYENPQDVHRRPQFQRDEAGEIARLLRKEPECASGSAAD